MRSSALETPDCAPSISSVPSLSPVTLLVKRDAPATMTQTGRIPALDGLRGIAILLVLLRHSVIGTPTDSKFWTSLLDIGRLTWSGVDLFFVLSGFLIGGILLDARNSPRYFQTFYIRRAYRILPIYGAFILLYLGRHLPIHFLPSVFGDTSPLPIPWFSYLTLTQNIWMAGFGWFGPLAIAPTWSLAVEEQFYLTVPFLIRKVRARTLCIALLGVIAGAPLLRIFLLRVLAHGAFACYVLMPCRADALCLGVLAALLTRNQSFREWLKGNSWVVYLAMTITFLGMAFLTWSGSTQESPAMTTWGFSCLAFFYASVLLAAVTGLSGRLNRALCIRLLGRLGAIAYCTYLIHEPLILAARRSLSSHSGLSPAGIWAVGGVFGVFAGLAIASLSWKYFEKPLVRRGHEYHY
jgi:peptidoglycan/LPS O-acetylase OafA/YrhL